MDKVWVDFISLKEKSISRMYDFLSVYKYKLLKISDCYEKTTSKKLNITSYFYPKWSSDCETKGNLF